MFSRSNYDPFGFDYPFVNFTGAGPLSSPSSPYYERLQRRRRRRQEQLATTRRQIMVEEEHRRKAAEVERREQRVEEEEVARRRRRREMELSQRARGEAPLSSFSPGTVVLGPDGNLYRVAEAPIRHSEGGDEIMASESEREFDMQFSHGSDDDRMGLEEDEDDEVEVSFSDKKFDDYAHTKADEEEDLDLAGYESASSQEWHDCEDIIDDDLHARYHTHKGRRAYDTTTTDPARLPVQRNQLVPPLEEIIAVENVPDEEDEELRELRSVWRNRIPSPGQWMEPVESFREQ